MARITSDDESVSAIRVDLVRSGGTRRLCVRLPDDDHLPTRRESGTAESIGVQGGDVVRVIVDRQTWYARIEADSRGRLLRGLFDNRRLARTPGDGENRLREWLQDHGREDGDVLLLDIVVDGDAYGLRLPGERAVYDVDADPRGSLADIARDLDG